MTSTITSKRRKIARRVQKTLVGILGDWSNNYMGSSGDDPLVAVCVCPVNYLLGLHFEGLLPPSFSTMLKGKSYRAKMVELEDGLQRAMEIYGATRCFVGLVFEVPTTGNFFIYTGCPIIDSPVNIIRLNHSPLERRYVCSLDQFLEAMTSGELSL